MLALYILIGLQLADIITTVLCLRTGRAVEANPLLAKLFDAMGVVRGLLLVKSLFVGVLLWAAPQLDPALLWLGVAGYGWVIYNNVKVLLGARNGL